MPILLSGHCSDITVAVMSPLSHRGWNLRCYIIYLVVECLQRCLLKTSWLFNRQFKFNSWINSKIKQLGCWYQWAISWPLQSSLEKIPISDRFVTQLHICAVVHIYKKPIQTLYHWRGWTTMWRLSLNVEWSVKHHRWTIEVPLPNN